MNNDQKQCPNCKSYKVQSVTAMRILAAVIALPIGLVFLIVFPPLGILCLIGAVILIPVLLISAAAGKKGKYVCQQCHWNGTEVELGK